MNDTAQIAEPIINKILAIIKNESGIAIRNEKLIDFEIVLRGRIIRTNLTPESYIQFLKCNDSEIVKLASFFTIQETCFYRNKNHFDRLKTQLLPELIEKKTLEKNKTLTIVSAGCATGEEPYTLAMIIKELPYNLDTWDIQIIATDIYKKALKHAREGVYSEYKLRNLDPYYISKYFNKLEENKIIKYRLKEFVKHMIDFIHCNLIKEPFQLDNLNDVDIILCENVIIYFNIESTQRLINNFYKILRNGGYLFLGYTETLNMINHNFSLTWWQDSFAYYKPENPVKTIETNNQVSMPEIPLDNRFISTSFNEFIFLALQNYKEGNIENVALVVEEIEKNNMSVNTEFYLIKAELLLDRQDFINSAHSCRNAISINPYFLDAHLMLIDIYLQLDMLDRADFEIKTSLYIDNSSILAYYYYSLYCKTIKDLNGYHKAVSKIKRLLSTSGTILSDNLYPINKKRRKHIFKDIMKFQAE